MRWDAVLETMVTEAEAELVAFGEARGWVVAYAAEAHLASVGLRGFDRGEIATVIREAAALTGLLAADRLAFVGSGRAWSLHDPIPPVTGAGDLRQLVIVAEIVEAIGTGVERTSRGWPVDVHEDTVCRGEPICEQTTGPIGRILEAAVGRRPRFDDRADACEQVGLLRDRGYLVHLGETTAWDLGFAGSGMWDGRIDLSSRRDATDWSDV